jgi:phosphodiesterase/alkaline phosphatase D-like protein
MQHAEVFPHGVASGDPLADRVMLWTRVTAGVEPVEVEWSWHVITSCAKYTAGYFNAYRLIAGRDGIDLWLHLGDSIYEYPSRDGKAPGPASAGRWTRNTSAEYWTTTAAVCPLPARS